MREEDGQMKKKQLVDLPAKRISYKKGPNGTKYVYYTLRSYRNAQGKPTSDEKSIGKLDEATGSSFPTKTTLTYSQVNARISLKRFNRWAMWKLWPV